MLNCSRLLSQAVKTTVLFVITFATIVFLIRSGSLVSNLSACPGEIITSTVYNAPQNQTPSDVSEVRWTPKLDTQVLSTSNTMPNNTTQEKTEENSRPLLTTQTMNREEEEDSDAPDPLIPPSNVKREERMEWIRKKAPELQILNSNDSGQKFHGRVTEFFSKECTNQFFMIWLSPARTFGPREFLGADTLLKANSQACLMILSRSLDTGRGYRILKPLLDRGLKIVAVTPDVPFIVKNTPAEAWLDDLKSGKRDPGSISLSVNLSNLIRLAIVYKYGGVYLDTDFIITRSFEGLRNAVGVQTIDQATKNWTAVNNAVLIFDIGHPILVNFLKEFATTFDGTKWGHNGPNMLSRVIKRMDKEGTPGYNLTILPTKAFYPVDWIKIRMLYKKPKTEEESKWVADKVVELSKESYGLHLWNKMTRGLVIEEGSVIERLIASHCFVCKDTYNS